MGSLKHARRRERASSVVFAVVWATVFGLGFFAFLTFREASSSAALPSEFEALTLGGSPGTRSNPMCSGDTTTQSLSFLTHEGADEFGRIADLVTSSADGWSVERIHGAGIVVDGIHRVALDQTLITAERTTDDQSDVVVLIVEKFTPGSQVTNNWRSNDAPARQEALISTQWHRGCTPEQPLSWWMRAVSDRSVLHCADDLAPELHFMRGLPSNHACN